MYENAIDFLQDAIDYLGGTGDRPQDPEAALAAIAEAEEAINQATLDSA